MPKENGYSQAWDEAAEKDRIKTILKPYENKNFVKRILDPTKYPILPMPEQGEGGYGTHLMSYSTVGNGAMVYPQIIQDSSGNLKRLSTAEALKHAQETGEFIPFDKVSDADWFGKNYKKLWDQQIWENLKSRKLN